MAKSMNFFTTSALLALAADIMIKRTDARTGSHPLVSEVIAEGLNNGFNKGVVQRANKLFEHMYARDTAIPKTGAKKAVKANLFGANSSRSLDKYAVKNVIKNRDSRVNALKAASERAAQNWRKWYV